MEKVSVIVPVYNGEKCVKRCADSILNQDYPELELILVDDGSRDRSWEIMQAIAAADHRVKAIHQENGGVSSARNRALAEASGTYVQFADVDDWLPMDATKLLVREMEAQSSELVVGDFYAGSKTPEKATHLFLCGDDSRNPYIQLPRCPISCRESH